MNPLVLWPGSPFEIVDGGLVVGKPPAPLGVASSPKN